MIKSNSKAPFERGFLTWLGPHQSEIHEVGEFTTIGRDPNCDIYLDNPFVSTRHARLKKRDNRYLIEDIRSKNGTYVNGTRVVEAELRDKDRIIIGEKEFLFSIEFENKKDQITLSSKNEKWNSQLERLPRMAESDFPIMITGPSGTGKEILAQLIHRYSRRSYGPFISVNCSALSENLVESELFGHLKGSFTGAELNRKGAFESARGGTLFLDEIGDLPISLQPKLLRALENSEVKPVGSDESLKTDVRIIAATHNTLKEKVRKGHFREDLYFRLNVLNISPPALNKRMEDFESLLYYFAKEYRVSFSHLAIQKLKQHSWPGNIRELRNLIAKASTIFSSRSISEENIDGLIDKNYLSPVSIESFVKDNLTLKEIEREVICKSLANHGGNQRRVAETLGLAKSTLNDRIKHHKIDLLEFNK